MYYARYAPRARETAEAVRSVVRGGGRAVLVNFGYALETRFEAEAVRFPETFVTCAQNEGKRPKRGSPKTRRPIPTPPTTPQNGATRRPQAPSKMSNHFLLALLLAPAAYVVRGFGS